MLGKLNQTEQCFNYRLFDHHLASFSRPEDIQEDGIEIDVCDYKWSKNAKIGDVIQIIEGRGVDLW